MVAKNVRDTNKMNSLSERIADYRSVMHRFVGEISDPEERKEFLEKISKKNISTIIPEINIKSENAKWRYSETVKYLEFGNNWYNHISKYFFHSDVENLKSNAYEGGVLSYNQPFDIYVFAFFLDYLVSQSLVMIMYSAFLFDEGESILYKSSDFLKKKKVASNRYNNELDQCITK